METHTPTHARMRKLWLHQLHQLHQKEVGMDNREMHIYAFLPLQKKQGSFVRKNRLPMKKSSVRFFHGEPPFSGTRPP